MSPQDAQDACACLGARTLPATLSSFDDADECVCCSKVVRSDMVSDPLFGFSPRNGGACEVAAKLLSPSSGGR